jgi:peptide/nickel transport system ATP-binding protein
VPPILEVDQLSVSFGKGNKRTPAVKNLSFSLEKGKTLGIVGESGSGKSVTALSIMRLLPEPPANIHSGAIRLDTGKEKLDLLSVPKEKMRYFRGNRIGMIFQEPMTALNPVFRCGHQLIEAIKIHHQLSKAEARKRAINWLERVQLTDTDRIFRAYPHQISGGQKQRVLIAMAMCCHPQILIADEPTTALDVTVQREILELIRQLQQEYETSVIFISHDLGVIAEIADDVLVMRRGEEMEKASVLEVFSNPKSAYTRGLLACRPPLDVRLSRLPVIGDFLAEEEDESEEKTVLSLDDLKIEEHSYRIERKNRLQQDPVLKVQNLKTWFPKDKKLLGGAKSYTKAVDDVSFEVYPGEIIGLVGESGCGKTTLGRTIIQLQQAREGEILYKGENIQQMRGARLKQLRQKMQIVFQDPYASLNPRMTIGRALKEPMMVHSLYSSDQEREKKVMELMEMVGLSPELLNRYPHEFSGGQRQRICIARALSLQPDFIVFDESVSALDVSVQAQIINLILELRQSMDFSCIFISHDLSVVKFISDRMLVMYNGKILESGWPEDVYEKPENAYTRRLIEAIPKGSVEEIRRRMKKN